MSNNDDPRRSMFTRFQRCAGCLALVILLVATTIKAQVTPVFTINHGYPPVQAGFPDGTGDGFGTTLASIGNGDFLVGIPSFDLASRLTVVNPYFVSPDKGRAQRYGPDAGAFAFGFSLSPNRESYTLTGTGLSGFEDGRSLLGSPGKTNIINGVVYYGVGLVTLFDATGLNQLSWTNPAGLTSANDQFGKTIATLPGNRFAASSQNGFRRVYIFDAAAVAPPLLVITNPTPSFNFENFGDAIAPLGTDRILIGDPGDDSDLPRYGSVMLFDLAGNLLRTIRNPNDADKASANFGERILAVDDHRFLVAAPVADAIYSPGGGLQATNQNAGAVYLYTDTGTLLQTFVAPDPANSGSFGKSMALLGPGRVLIGAPFEKQSGQAVGRVHLFNLAGVHLQFIDNPDKQAFDKFGESIVALSETRFVVGAPDDDTLRVNGGSVYGFDIPLPSVELGTAIPQPNNVDGTGTFPSQGPTVTPPDATFWHVPSQTLYAVKPGAVLVSWKLSGTFGTNNWEASVTWPTNENRYQVHVAGQGAVDVGGGGVFSNAVLHATTTDADASAVSQLRRFAATVPGTSLLMLSGGSPATNPIRFQFVKTIAWNDPDHLHDNAPATIGQPITDPGGYYDPAAGSPQVVLAGSVFAPAPVFDPATRTGTIIPVNRDNPASSTDDPVVAYYQLGTKLHDPHPVTGGPVANSIAWPYKPVRFAPVWPTSSPKIIVASLLGTGAINPTQFVEWQLYYQNNPALAGFNPNDEHALNSGEAVFALRDDLGTPTTSEPFVLIRYRDPANGLQWRMKVWQVVAEEAPYFFRYPAEAGKLLQAPFPLSLLAPALETSGVSGPYFRDRNHPATHSFWARAAGNDGGMAEIVMRYFYPMQSSFFMPGANPPIVGASVPLLDLRAGSPGTPINVRFETTWPDNVPELRVGETLVKPKFGLPDIDGQTSVEVLYQQASALGQGSSVRLIDPVRIRSAALAQLPLDIETRSSAGLLYFPALPPHLENRISYDSNLDRLQLRGEFVEPPAGESYLLLNVLTPRDKAVLLALTTDTAFRNAVEALATQSANVLEVPANSTGFDSLALTAGDAQGTGYVTLAFNNSTNLGDAGPIVPIVIKVTCPLYRGELKVIEHSNPLAEQLTLRHSGDFAGRPDDYEFEWRTLPPVDGLPSTQPPAQWIQFQSSPATGIGAVDITLSGPGLFTLSDNYFVCRYRRIAGPTPCGPDWSAWTEPMLAEGWIKRVLAGIGPFEQRIRDYQNTQVNTIVSMISQAGARSVGDVALNLDAVNSVGLIELYETVLRRGINLSIAGAPPVDYPPANDALLLAAGRLADLYMLVGNEAYADAADPTIAFGTDDGVYGSQATSLHCFMNQTASLLEEELALLRGRDNSKLPSVETHPFYNRLIWNFTRDITGGEVAYALNYNLRNVNGDVAGAIDEADARQLYPQGHGDAWGHYLTATKNYYRLLRSPNFTWVPRIEAVLVGGVPVSVDFLDERKFAAAAAARARTGAEIVNLTFRDRYVENPAKPWQTDPDANSARAWSLPDWASRAGQGAFFDWVTANALLPDVDANPAHTGIQKIERGLIRELPEIVEAYRLIQEQADQADGGRNPLGLANNVVPFDIDPSAIAAGKTHFDQINERANKALENAVAVFDYANASTQLLRRQADDAAQFQNVIGDRESDFNNRLIEIFGTPYPDDIGPTGTYATGYIGPDIYHFEYVDSPELDAVIGPPQSVQLELMDLSVTSAGGVNKTPISVTFHISPNGLGLAKPATWIAPRGSLGEIQQAQLAMVTALRRLQRAVTEYENLIAQIEDAEEQFRAEFLLGQTGIIIRSGQLARLAELNDQIADLREGASQLRDRAATFQRRYDFAAEALPTVIGISSDSFAPVRAAQRLMGRLVADVFEDTAALNDLRSAELQDEKGELAAQADLELTLAQIGFTTQQRLDQLEQLVRQERPARQELAALGTGVEEAFGRHQAAIARGLRLLEERTRFRQQTAAQVQSYRYKDMAFRVFRSDALQKYRAQFDLAARYAYLAARAYDYETSLAPGDNRGPGSAFLTSIIRSRSLGLFSGGNPLPGSGSGDPGIADPLARMTINWNLVLKGQLGFNNPQTETGRFSLRNELFRVLTGSSGSQRWRETLQRHVVPNLRTMPEFQRHCIPFSPTQPAEPAIVIPFATTINFGLNFFGWPAGGGDNDYDSTKFATKVRSVGVWFANYNNLGGGMINTPRVYLVPVGLDVMRSPSQGQPYIREWRILDQALPVPFPLSGGTLNDPTWIPINDSLAEDFAALRRFGQFRAYHDSGNFNPAETINDSRLIGRSVWNTRWLLIIPAGTLHTDRNEGIQRFINGALLPNGNRDGNGVSDIKIFFQTYAYSGN
ncbi:MAG: hypothetical protein IH623_03875 [Verrucomicrobia bacterium]|nr:hypothetical protein [Verrucomicrobiota bacterium]